MNTILKSYDSDEGLLQSLNEITRKLDDRETKLNRKSTRVAKVSATESNGGTGEAGDALLEAINALRVEVTNLKKDVASAQSSGNGTNRRQQRRSICKRCEQDGKTESCDHCFACFQSGHRKGDPGCSKKKSEN
jgi:hypothetical protein